MAITIPDSDGRDQYVATAAQTVFPYTYPVFDEDHLVVQHTVDLTGVTTTLTITTDYTVDGVGTDNGDVTLVSGAAVDDVITIERDTPIARSTDFLDGGDYRAESINRELDLIVQMMQQNERNIGRAFRLQSEDVSVDLLIPLLAARAGKYLVFDASGDPAVASGSGTDAALRTDLAAVGGAQLVGNPASGGLAGITVGDQLDELESEKATLASPAFTGTVTLPDVVVSGDTTLNTATAGKLFKFTKGGDIASASPLVIDTDGNYFDVTGTTNFAAMTVAAGALFIVQFDGVLTMTHHATNLDLPGEADITTAAGDSMICFATGANTVHVISYTRADGTALVVNTRIIMDTPVATTSGTAHDFTGIPAGVKKIRLMLAGVSTDGTSSLLVQLGDAGGMEATGYISNSQHAAATAVSTIGLVVTQVNAAATNCQGVVELCLLDASTFSWASMSNICDSASLASHSAGSKSLSAELTQIRLTTVNGTDAFDAGKINIQYEI